MCETRGYVMAILHRKQGCYVIKGHDRKKITGSKENTLTLSNTSVHPSFLGRSPSVETVLYFQIKLQRKKKYMYLTGRKNDS